MQTPKKDYFVDLHFQIDGYAAPFVALKKAGRVPAEARPIVYGGRLVAPAKPGGGAH